MRISLFIVSLDTGGAEQQMVRLANALASRGHQVELITCFGGALEAKVSDTVHLTLLDSTHRQGTAKRLTYLMRAWLPLCRRLKANQSEVALSALYASNAVLYFATRWRRKRPLLVWSIRTAQPKSKLVIRFWYYLGRVFSPSVDLLIANSSRGLDYHLKHGYRPKAQQVVANLISPPAAPFESRERERASPMRVGMVGRIDRTKNLGLALRAFARAKQAVALAPLRIIGPVSDVGYREELDSLVAELGLSGDITWQGGVDDPEPYYREMDVLLNGSDTEGFSNVIAEAMASGVRCVVTDVGESARIVGEAGLVVPAGRVEPMAAALIALARGEASFTLSPQLQIQKQFCPDAVLNTLETALLEARHRCH